MEHIVQIGVREVEPEEASHLEQSGITRIGPNDLARLREVVDELAKRVGQVYVHVDVDVLDLSEGWANTYACRGGLTLEDLYGALEIFCLDAETGKPIWRQPAELPVWGAPVVAGDQLFVGIGNGNFMTSDDKPQGGSGAAEDSPSKELKEFAAKYFHAWPANRKPELILFFSGEQHSYEAPCGCTGQPQ